MVSIKILGPGCPNCRRLEAAVRRVIEMQGIGAHVEKVSDLAEIVKYGILGMPGLVVDDRLVSAGRVPPEKDIAAWLSQAATKRTSSRQPTGRETNGNAH